MTTLGARRNQAGQYLYRLTPADPEMLARSPQPHEAQAIHEHYEYLKQLSVIGTVILMGRTAVDDASAFGLVIIEATSDEEARRVMLEDPAVREGVMNAELFPFRVMIQRRAPSIQSYSSRT